jgi:iron-sulfur cluster assembly accessory protein
MMQERNNMITLTDKAAQMIQDVIDAQELKNAYLEFRITGGGCSGLQYGLGLTEIDDLAIDEVVFESNGVNIVTTLKESKYVEGCVIDYIDLPMGAGFKVTNPNATKTCGCGSSFSTGDDDISDLNEGKGCGSCRG